MAWEKFKYAETETTLPALILIADELAEFVEGRERSEMRLVDKFQENIASIARLGRAAHIHVVLATQSATGNLFPTSLKNNITARFIAGSVASNISMMSIDSEEGASLPDTPGSYLAFFDKKTQAYQGFFTKQKDVLSFGTVKDGYDKDTGLLSEDRIDMSPVEDYEDGKEEEEQEEQGFDGFEINDVVEENVEDTDYSNIFNSMDNNIASFDNESPPVGNSEPEDQDIESMFGGVAQEQQPSQKPKLKIEKKVIKLNTTGNSNRKNNRPSGGSIIIE